MLKNATFRFMVCNLLMVGLLATQNLTGLLNSDEYVAHVNSALQHFNQEFLQHRTSVVSLTFQSNCKESKHIFDELANRFLRQSNQFKVVIQTSKVKLTQNYNICFVDSFAAFLKIDPGRNSKRHDFSEYYIIVLRRNAHTFMAEQQQIFDYCWRHYIMNVVIIWHSDVGEVALYTYYPFLENNCNRAVAVRLNPNFSIALLTTRQLFPNKLKDLHQCKLTVALWNEPPYLILPLYQEGELHFKGFEGHLLHLLAETMSFTIGYVVPPNNEQRGMVLGNRSVTGALRLLVNQEANLSLGAFRCKADRSDICSASKSFYQTTMVWIVLATRTPWTTYEILVYPFNISLWLALICMLVALFLLAGWLQCKHPNTLSFVFNYPQHTSIPLHLTAAFLGVPMHRLPRRNFARFLWSLWQALTLLLRCGYQCLLFQFLSSQKMIPPPNEMFQLVRQGYKLVVHLSIKDALSDVSIVHQRLLEVIPYNTTNASYGLQILEEHPLEKYVVPTTIDVLLHYASSNGKHGVFHVLKESVFSMQNCIYFSKHSFLVPAVDEILSNLRNAGLIEFWAAHYLFGHGGKKPYIKPEPLNKPFTMVQLYGAFQILYCFWFLAVLVFLLECLWFRIKTSKNLKKI